MNADDFASRRARLDADGQPSSTLRYIDPQRTHGMPRRLCNKLSKSHAMIGVMSIGPSVGISLRSGATIHSVKMYDHRTHPE